VVGDGGEKEVSLMIMATSRYVRVPTGLVLHTELLSGSGYLTMVGHVCGTKSSSSCLFHIRGV
jgi:hypothetical protein